LATIWIPGTNPLNVMPGVCGIVPGYGPWEPPTGQKAPVPFWQHSGVFSGECR
jgi:hypothetical protein